MLECTSTTDGGRLPDEETEKAPRRNEPGRGMCGLLLIIHAVGKPGKPELSRGQSFHRPGESFGHTFFQVSEMIPVVPFEAAGNCL